MRIVHRIALTADEADRREIDRLGIKVRPPAKISDGWVFFDITESDDSWPGVRDWIERRRPSDLVTTRFSQREIEAARWLSVEPDWHHGFPQPEDDFGYIRTTYDPASYCDECGVGAVQRAPFVMSGEPKWGTRGILQLNWVFDEFFVTPEVHETVFAPHGIGLRPVRNGRGAELRSVVQLVVEERVSVDTRGLECQKCARCGRVKYLPVTRGPLPRLMAEPRGHVSRTTEWFGSGGEAHNEIIVSQALARAIGEAGVKGVSFSPVGPLDEGSK
jgi:hypothetical protein